MYGISFDPIYYSQMLTHWFGFEIESFLVPFEVWPSTLDFLSFVDSMHLCCKPQSWAIWSYQWHLNRILFVICGMQHKGLSLYILGIFFTLPLFLESLHLREHSSLNHIREKRGNCNWVADYCTFYLLNVQGILSQQELVKTF